MPTLGRKVILLRRSWWREVIHARRIKNHQRRVGIEPAIKRTVYQHLVWLNASHTRVMVPSGGGDLVEPLSNKAGVDTGKDRGAAGGPCRNSVGSNITSSQQAD